MDIHSLKMVTHLGLGNYADSAQYNPYDVASVIKNGADAYATPTWLVLWGDIGAAPRGPSEAIADDEVRVVCDKKDLVDALANIELGLGRLKRVTVISPQPSSY